MKNTNYKTAEMRFEDYGYKQCVNVIKNYLIKETKLARETSQAEFLEACSEGNLLVVMKCIAKNKSIVNDAFTINGMTGLMLAVSQKKSSIVKKILSTPEVDISEIDFSDHTALHHSCLANNIRSLDYILQHPSCRLEFVRMKNNKGETAEVLAARLGHGECVLKIKKFIESKCNTIDSSTSASTSTQMLNQPSTSNLMSQGTRPGSSMSLDEIQADLRNLIDIEESRDDRLEKLKEKEQQEIQHFQDIMKDIVATQNDIINQIKADYELEQKRREKEHQEQISKEEEMLENLLTKLQEDLCAMKEQHQKEKDDERNNFTKGQERKRELQEELQTRITPLLAPSNTSSADSSIIPDCYVCFENCRPPLKLMTCETGHIVCEPCFQLMVRKICGKCRSSITGRATDTEEMIRKVLR